MRRNAVGSGPLLDGGLGLRQIGRHWSLGKVHKFDLAEVGEGVWEGRVDDRQLIKMTKNQMGHLHIEVTSIY